MNIQTPIPSIGRTSTDDQYFLILTDGYSPERTAFERTYAQTVKDIRSGEVKDVAKVIEVNLAIGCCRDVSEDVAHEILAEFRNQGWPLSDSAKDFWFLHLHDPAIFEVATE